MTFLTLQVDGTKGSAVVGLRDCWIQDYDSTPKPVWNPDIPNPIDFKEGWTKVSEHEEFENAFRVQWELYLKHILIDTPFPWNLMRGLKEFSWLS